MTTVVFEICISNIIQWKEDGKIIVVEVHSLSFCSSENIMVVDVKHLRWTII